MSLFRIHNSILLLFVLFCIGCNAEQQDSLKADYYVIVFNEDDVKSERWATYLFNHLSKRTTHKQVVFLGNIPSNIQGKVLELHWRLAPELPEDYCVKNSKGTLSLNVKDDKTATWMVYQLIEAISQHDKRFTTEDLPPAIIDFQDACKAFDFNYREPYYLANLQGDTAAVLGNNNIETDWGIWGHNLVKITKDLHDQSIYSIVDNQKNPQQLCFSSAELYNHISAYILENYGKGITGSPIRFMIMPQDNDLVCMCAECKELGNTAQSASQSVYYLVDKLALNFKNHEFFMVAYRTTKARVRGPIRNNIGVFISSIDLDKGVDVSLGESENEATMSFVDLVQQWKEQAAHVYIWDYSANFDDFLSPIPVLFSMVKRLQWYKELGVSGVFFNAAGYDYSAFHDVQTYVISALLKDTTLDVSVLIDSYFKKNYPNSHHLLNSYYLSLEQQYAQRAKAYDMYGSMLSNLNTYLDKQALIKFYHDLVTVKALSTGQELEELEKLYSAISFSMSQMQLSQSAIGGDSIERIDWHNNPYLRVLKKASDLGIENYKESLGDIKQYCDFLESIPKGELQNNLLVGKGIEVNGNITKEAGYLSDGLPGHMLDYHVGWYLNGQDQIDLSFDVSDFHGFKQLDVRFLLQDKHRFVLAESIDILSDNLVALSWNPQWMIQDDQLMIYRVNIDVTGVDKLTLKINKGRGKRTAIAVDEIVLINYEKDEK